MQFIDKSNLYPIAEFSNKVTANIYWLKKELWGVEEDLNTRLFDIKQNLGRSSASIQHETPKRKFVLARHFSKLEKKLLKYNIDINLYATVLTCLSNCDRENLVTKGIIQPLTGVDKKLHVVYSTEMADYSTVLLKQDRRFQQIFYNRFLPRNESVLLLLELTTDQVLLFGIGRSSDLFKFSTNYYAVT